MSVGDAAGAGASITPLSDSQADLAKVTVEEAGKLGRYVGRILGDVPENLVQVLLGQHLRFARVVIADGYDRRISEIFARRDSRTAPVSPSLAVPLIEAAYEESRPELQQMWAELIAAAMDPTRSSRVRLRFVETVKQLDPLDALILRERTTHSGDLSPNAVHFFVQRFSRGMDDVTVSIDNLERLGCVIVSPRDRVGFALTNYGRELVRACSD